MEKNNITVGNITGVSGEVNIAGGNIYVGLTVEEVAALLAQSQSQFQGKIFDGRCPYKGLEVFEEEDAGLFFGREKAVDDLSSRVRKSRAVFITGPSGSGKSSLVRAGLIPTLKQGAIADLHSETWLYAALKPGRDPLAALALAIARLKTPELGNYLYQHAGQPGALNECLESALSDRQEQRVVLFIDQFEEVFTQLDRETERVTFLNLLTQAATAASGRGIVLFAMRSDFIPNCAAYPQLNGLLNQQFVQIGAMQPEELVSSIAQPALRVGLRIDPDLITQIINDMQGEPGALPLMQFTLKDLFEAEQARGGVIALTLATYLERGGIHKSLERHADAAFEQLEVKEQQLARSIFGGLVEIGRGSQDTRRTAWLDELVPPDVRSAEVQAVVEKLADARLITTDQEGKNETVVLAHERLIDAWPWLKKLVDENRDALAIQNEIQADAKEWQAHQQDPSYLYTGVRLADVSEKLDHKKIALGGTAREFVRVGRTRRRQAQFARIGAGLVLFLALIMAVIIFKSQSDANGRLAGQNGVIANTAQAASNLAVANQATSQANAADARHQASTAQAASALAVANQATAQANAEEASRQANIALARQMVVQAQSINLRGDSEHLAAVLLATRSMEVFPSYEASLIMDTNIYGHVIAQMTHSDIVSAIAISPDGKYVVSASVDKTARVWEAATGKELARMTHAEYVNAVAFSPDGKYVVSGSGDNTARVWEAASGRELARMTHTGPVSSVAFSPDGKYVVSGSADKTARVWEAASGKELARMTHADSVSSVAFSPNGRDVVSASADQTARVWEAASGKELARMTHAGPVDSLAISPDGKYVVSGSGDNTARVWEAASGKELARLTHAGPVTLVAFSPDGRYIVSVGADNSARVWEAASGKELARLTHDNVIFSVAFSPDGKYIISGSEDNTARVWEATSGKQLASITTTDAVASVAFSPDGRYLVSAGYDKTARVWEESSGKELARLTHDGQVTSAAFSPDGKYVASAGEDKTVRVWEAKSGSEVARLTSGDEIWSVAFSPDGRFIVSGGADNTARVWEVATGKEVARMTHASVVTSVAFSPDGKVVASGSLDGTALVWEAASGKELARMPHGIFVTSVAFSPDGRYIVTGSFDSTARVWEAATGKEVMDLAHNNVVTSVAFSPDGRYIVTGDNDYSVRLWDASTGKELESMTHDNQVTSVAFSPDGKYIVSGSVDNTARVWEVKSAKEMARMTHDHQVTSVAFSPNGKYVVSGSTDKTARVWIWQAEDLIADACARLPRNLTLDEWKLYFGDEPYQASCSNLPPEPVLPVPMSVP